jgi:hypothetical protein
MIPKSKIPAAGSCRKTPEIPGTGSSISAENCPDFFPMDSCQLPVHFDRNRLEIIEKVRKFSGRNTTAIFQRFSGFSGRNRPVLIDLGNV